MIIDAHAHVTAPDSLYVYKAGLLAHRGGHGRGAVNASDEDIIKTLNSPVFGGSSHLEQLKEAGFWLYGLDERGDTAISTLDLKGRVGIVLGAEGEGLRRLTAEKCDRLVTIPTQAALAALNVSNAAAVAAYEWARQS